MNQETLLKALKLNKEYTKIEIAKLAFKDKSITSSDTRYSSTCNIVKRICKSQFMDKTFKDKKPMYIKRIEL